MFSQILFLSDYPFKSELRDVIKNCRVSKTPQYTVLEMKSMMRNYSYQYSTYYSVGRFVVLLSAIEWFYSMGSDKDKKSFVCAMCN